MSQVNFKKSCVPDTLLKKTELKARCIFHKIIEASLNLNNYFGKGEFSRTQLWERVNCYLEKDHYKRLSFSCFRNYLKKLNDMRVKSQRILASEGKGLGEKKGAYFVVALSEEAHYLVNHFFYSLKVDRLRERKTSRLRNQKVGRQLVYLENLLTSPVKYSCPQEFKNSQRSHSSQEKRTLVSTERIYDKSFLGTGAYKQALKDLEGMEVSREHTIEIERILINSIAKENATLNLRDFLKDLEPDKRQSGVQVYLRELKSLKGSMRLMRKGSQKYTKILEEVLHPPKTNFKTNRILSVYEENEKYNIIPATPEEADEIWKGFFERKEKDKNDWV